jgi:hypothetical protein
MRGLAAAVLAGLLASGCGGSPEPGQLPAPERSSTPSASATPAPPVMPKAAKAKTRAGAESAVRFFLSSMEYAGKSGDISAFQRSYTRECTRCSAIARGIRDTYANGGSITGGGWRPTQLRFYAIRNNVAYIDATVDYEPQTWIRASDAPKLTSPARKGVLKPFQLVWRDETWRVGALDPQL